MAAGLTACTPQEQQAGSSAPAASDAARGEFKALFEKIAGADGHVYGAHDDQGHTMDGAKIIENPAAAGSFLAVYHAYDDIAFQVYLAVSIDLLRWTCVTHLAADASQPTIRAVDAGFMLVWEQQPDNHIRLAYYDTWDALAAASPSHAFDCPRQLSSYAEGTPDIRAATPDSAEIGFHYYQNGKVDRQATGTMSGWTDWTAAALPELDKAVLAAGAPKAGNIGDRDNLNFDGFDFLVIEAGGTNSTFQNWRCYLYDALTRTAEKLSPVTGGGSIAFANPTAAVVTLDGRQALVCTVFIPSEGCGPGEAGSCVYYNYIS